MIRRVLSILLLARRRTERVTVATMRLTDNGCPVPGGDSRLLQG